MQAYDPASGQSSAQTVEHVWVNHDSDLLDVTLLAAAGTAASPSAAASADAKQRDAEVASHGLRAPPSANGGDEEQHRNDPQGNGQHREQHEIVHTTANHPWLTADRGFVLAGTLQPGESVVRLDGSTATVAAVRVVPGEADYYNLTVSQVHTYAVGAGQYVVHNCGGGLFKDFKTSIPEQRVDHATRHLVDAGVLKRTSTMAERRQFLERATQSRLRIPWKSGSDKTVAFLVHVPGFQRRVAVQFYRDSGEVATGFYASSKQYRSMIGLARRVYRNGR